MRASQSFEAEKVVLVGLSSSAQKVSTEEVRHIAELSNLRLTPEEETMMQRDLNAILEYVAQLNELDTSEIEPMAQVGELLAERKLNDKDSRAVLRQDVAVSSLKRDAVMASAPETDGAFFKVPKVIER
jgi:aspartyl-tRNA(Asn)/glutamyl-tRNA(Gln) amidotransferase subunit C